jgi:hypothetical protein
MRVLEKRCMLKPVICAGLGFGFRVRIRKENEVIVRSGLRVVVKALDLDRNAMGAAHTQNQRQACDGCREQDR